MIWGESQLRSWLSLWSEVCELSKGSG